MKSLIIYRKLCKIAETVGMLKIDDYRTETGKEISKLFENNKPKRQGKFIFEKRDDGPDFDKLNRDAVKSLHVLPEVVKTDGGFEVL